MKSNRVLGRGLKEISSNQPESIRLQNLIGNPVSDIVAPKDPSEMSEDEYNQEVAKEIASEFEISTEAALKLVQEKYKEHVAKCKSEGSFAYIPAEDIADKEDLSPKDADDDDFGDDEDVDLDLDDDDDLDDIDDDDEDDDEDSDDDDE